MASQKRTFGFVIFASLFIVLAVNQSAAAVAASPPLDQGSRSSSITFRGGRIRNSSVAAASGYPDEEEDDDDVVVLSLYYESLCPYCANFIVNQLVKVFQTDLASIVQLRLVPWGNTQITPNNAWVCQHGPDECKLNMVEACAIYAWPNPLERGYADETARLNPPHRFVPWVLVNNLPLREDYQNFVSYICKAYRGRLTPQACKSYKLEVNSANMVNPIQACFPENATSGIQFDPSLEQPGTYN
ncbi:gamma-interferon-responsive lysosomal thiol protein-like isoform X3 [Coffea arabica]|uniref:Gamma-interferon-responsive lysosomal thiol protein-like isoform X3 n=1 Tax=Coffea arabica TaxID=13443 RepID=A0A6P6SLG4_COFAR|nr:gamma-interferon-responsive lysosomal thiol protein-like isoform X3 [Coffea arabica]XP_027070352.1 gamma-interferon-responsive lysosomal thiol protein-like isoform X3 [Coffea arabica]